MPGEGKLTANFKLKDLNGRELALKDFRGKIVVLVFGELYQQNTLKTINDLKRLLSEKRSYREAVEVLLIVSEKRKADEYLKVKSGLEITYPVLLDDQRNVYAQFEIVAMPTTFIIDRQGKIAAKLPSFTIAYFDQVDAELGFLLGVVKPEELEKVMHPKAAPPDVNGKSERILSLADNLKRRGFYDSALDSYLKVLEKWPDLKEARIGAGTIYLKKTEAEKAEKEFQSVLEKTPDDPAALKGIAQVHLLRGEVERAEDLLQKVILSNYVDDDLYYIMGEVYEKQGKLKEAVSFYKKNCQKLLQKR
jgi:tetratricopeptide (TPR) repeat protein